MRVFVTGASGFIGSALVPELIDAGHEVLGLARSEASADALTAAGAVVHHGSLDDLDSLRKGAAASDGVIHLAFNHDFSDYVGAARTDLRAIETLGDALTGTGRPLVITAGTLGLPAGRVATENDVPASGPSAAPRNAGTLAALALAARGVRSSVLRLPPSVHGDGDHGFVPTLIEIARDKGVSGYIGDGSNCWPAVHRLDAAHLFRLALEQAPAGSVLHAVAEEGVAVRAIAEVIGRRLNRPTASIPQDQAGEHFGWLAGFLGADVRASSELTRKSLGWRPTRPGLIDDLDRDQYFRRSAA
ncbi:SDR family oxidoreductase [Nocardia sp. NPDC005366]|uniref:SDR family oxidoreductase n=1 Tax=Nocardia sp. NPDC005366 TaxID=3156878 RepID=UPI0033B946D2